jgi:iron complex outermembrane receptor protein
VWTHRAALIAAAALTASPAVAKGPMPPAAPAQAAPKPPLPATTPLYDPLGGPDQRNPLRSDLAQCSLWQGGPAGTLVPPGMMPPPVPPQGFHGLTAAGGAGACGRIEGLARASAMAQGVFVRGLMYGERAGNYRAPSGERVAYGYERLVYSGGLGFVRPDGSFLALDVTRADKRDVPYAGAGIDTRFFNATTLALNGRLALGSNTLKAIRLNASWTDFDRENDNFRQRPLVGAATLARFDRKLGQATLALDGATGPLNWTLAGHWRYDRRDATRFQGPLLAAQSPIIADGEVAQYGLSLDGTYAFSPAARLLAGVRLDLVQARLGRIDRPGLVTPGFGPTPTPRQVFRETYGYMGSGDADEANLGASLRFEQDIDAGQGRWFVGAKRVVRTADPRERYFVSFTPPMGQPLNPGPIHRTWIGNPALKPEQHHLAEIGLGWRKGPWELAARAYADHVTDFILWDRARGQVGVTRADTVNIFRNVEAFIGGVEGKARYRFENGLWLGLDGWLTYGQNLTDNRPIAQIPAAEAHLWAGWTHGPFELSGRLRMVATQARVDANFRTGSGVDGPGLPTTSQRLAGFATLDAQLTWRPRPNASVTVGVENILDRRYRELIERTDIDDPFTVNPRAAGRSVYARAAFQF